MPYGEIEEYFTWQNCQQTHKEKVTFLETELADVVVSQGDLNTLWMDIQNPTQKQRAAFLGWGIRLQNRRSHVAAQLAIYRKRLLKVKGIIAKIDANPLIKTTDKRRYSCIF
jgi:hypothetical protein